MKEMKVVWLELDTYKRAAKLKGDNLTFDMMIDTLLNEHDELIQARMRIAVMEVKQEELLRGWNPNV